MLGELDPEEPPEPPPGLAIKAVPPASSPAASNVKREVLPIAALPLKRPGGHITGGEMSQWGKKPVSREGRERGRVVPSGSGCC
jgi:hypothetical protein